MDSMSITAIGSCFFWAASAKDQELTTCINFEKTQIEDVLGGWWLKKKLVPDEWSKCELGPIIKDKGQCAEF